MKVSEKSAHIAYGVSLVATFVTLHILNVVFECPMFLSLFLITGAHALGYAALKVLPHYTLWLPPLTAAYLSLWYWLGTTVVPHFMFPDIERTLKFGSSDILISVWIATLIFCGAAGIILFIIKLNRGCSSDDEKPTPPSRRVHPVLRVAIYSLSLLLLVGSALGAYAYRESKIDRLTENMVYASDYTVPWLNFTAVEDTAVPACSVSVRENNVRITYRKIQDTDPHAYVLASQRFAFGKGDLHMDTVILSHKDSPLNPAENFTPATAQMLYTQGDTVQTRELPPELVEELMDILAGKRVAHEERPDGGFSSSPFLTTVQLTFHEAPALTWNAQIASTEDGQWYLSIHVLPDDFELDGSWYFPIRYYLLSDAWEVMAAP